MASATGSKLQARNPTAETEHRFFSACPIPIGYGLVLVGLI